MNTHDIELKELTNQNIFLSYKSRDEPEVHGLTVLLKNLGNKVTKMGEFPAGQWANHIYKSLETADTLLIYLSHAPEPAKLQKLFKAVGKTLLKTLQALTRRPKEPDDWMEEEFSYFKKLHGDQRKIIIYAEKDALQPAYLSGYQMHFYVSQLTEIREKWNQLKKDKVNRSDARRIVVQELKQHGVNLGREVEDKVLDMFGVHSLRSGVRYVWYRCKGAITFIPLVAVILLAMGAMFSLGRVGMENRVISPNTTQVDIGLNQSGRIACQNIGMVCVSVSQIRAEYGNNADSKFYGYATPTCESRLIKSSVCPRTFGSDYELSGVFYQRSVDTETPNVNLGRDRLCTDTVPFPNANCVLALGE